MGEGPGVPGRSPGALEVLGVLVRVLVRSTAPWGGYSVVEVLCPPDERASPPPHVHDRTDEILVMLEGRIEVLLEGQWVAVAAGAMVRVPTGVTHTFRNRGSAAARFVAIYHPGGVERLFEEVGVPAAWPPAGSSVAPLPIRPEQVARVLAAAARHDVRMARPPG